MNMKPESRGEQRRSTDKAERHSISGLTALAVARIENDHPGESFAPTRCRYDPDACTQAYDGFHNMVFTEESTVGAFLLRARREGLRDFGACMSPHTAWLILQGIETLPLRMARHVENTRRIVAFLAAHPMVAAVGYPELDGHPSQALAKPKRQMGISA